MIPVYKPYLNKNILKYAHDALDSTWISSTGKYIDLATESLKEFLGVKHVLLTNTGTAALHLVARTLRKKHNSTVDLLVPNSVYVAAWNAFMYDRNFRLVNTDTNLKTWNMDLTNFSHIKHKIQAILIVHNLGNVINVPTLMKENPHITFVEDACEAFGGYYEGYHSGTKSLMSAMSFYANKNITSGEGGAFITNDEDCYNYAKLLRDAGQSKDKFIHSELGYNYRMTNIESAILYGQLKYVNEILDKKWELFLRYSINLNGIVEFQIKEGATSPSYWMFGARIVGNPGFKKAEKFFSSVGVEIRPFFYPINTHRHLKAKWLNMDNAKLLSKEVIILPSYPELTNKEIDYISEKVKEYVKNI